MVITTFKFHNIVEKIHTFHNESSLHHHVNLYNTTL